MCMKKKIARYREAADYIASRLTNIPKTAIVLGTGLSRIARKLDDAVILPYATLPHFAPSTSDGHPGNLVCGTMGGVPVLVLQGRVHLYEGYPMEQVILPVRVMHFLGVKTLFVTNAAGSLRPLFRAGNLMMIRDHINFMPNPLRGVNDETLGPRYPDMSEAYSLELRDLAFREARKLGLELQEGVYAGLPGPSFETPAECMLLQRVGVDAVGMSTTPEVIAARHCGMRVFGLSVISNAAGTLEEEDNGTACIKRVQQTAGEVHMLLSAMLPHL